MAERPLLILPTPGEPAARLKKSGRGGLPHVPSRSRQGERLALRFAAVQHAFETQRARLQADPAGVVPEQVIVLETVGSVQDFIVAVRKVDGLEWLGEIEEEDIPPDDDFFVVDKKTQAPTQKTMRGRLFMILSNQQSLRELISLWDRWKAGQRLDHGLAKWGNLFTQLRNVRPWGVQDRLLETGVLDDWRERIEHDEEVVPCEIELWYRQNHQHRHAAFQRVSSLVSTHQGEVLGQAIVEEVAYHAILAALPVGAISPLLDDAGRDTDLVQCEQIQFFRASGQMAGIVNDDARVTDEAPVTDIEDDLLPPVVALLDGLPLQNHRRLDGRLVIDDPDGFETDYPAQDRRHGTAMASLITHGDLAENTEPIHRQLYVRPILRPDPKDWNQRRQEIAPENVLVVDLIHRAVRRLFEPDGHEPASAPQVCVINLSIGIRDRLFQSALSPLARLLDWLAWQYGVLFLVSAGNHIHPIHIDVPRDQVTGLRPSDLQEHVVRSIARDARHRRLLSPAESVNSLTVGASQGDAAEHADVVRAIHPYTDPNLPSVISAQGMGYRRSIKPDVLVHGGQIVLMESLQQDSPDSSASFDIYTQTRPPGHAVAAPGPNPGDLSYSWHTRGTSNATALLCRSACQLYDVLDELQEEPGGELIDEIPRALWLKALLAHAAQWGEPGDVLTGILRTSDNSRQFKEYLTRILGYGVVDTSRVGGCTSVRATALGGGSLQADQSHIHRFPLPPSLSGKPGVRRLTITLAWFTPVNPSHQGWRRADLWFMPPTDPLKVKRHEADWRAVQRGTLQHEVLEGKSAAAFVDGDQLEIHVSCRPDAGALEETIPYALAVSLEVAEDIGIDIYNEVRVRVHAARVAVAP